MARWQDEAPDSAHRMARRLDRLRLQDGVVRRVYYAARALIAPSPRVPVSTAPAAWTRVAVGPLRIAHDIVRRSLRWVRRRAWAECERTLVALPGSKVALALLPSAVAAKLRLRRNRNARAAAERAVEANPNDWVAWRSLGDALAALGHHHEAVGCYDRALALAPTDAAASTGRAAAIAAMSKNRGMHHRTIKTG
jgi:tetratricopeptide (TPR) repeat protein